MDRCAAFLAFVLSFLSALPYVAQHLHRSAGGKTQKFNRWGMNLSSRSESTIADRPLENYHSIAKGKDRLESSIAKSKLERFMQECIIERSAV